MGRYQPSRLDWDTREITEGVSFANGEQVEAWGILDTVDGCYVNRWGEPDANYWAAHRDVASMRANDLNAGTRV